VRGHKWYGDKDINEIRYTNFREKKKKFNYLVYIITLTLIKLESHYIVFFGEESPQYIVIVVFDQILFLL